MTYLINGTYVSNPDKFFVELPECIRWPNDDTFDCGDGFKVDLIAGIGIYGTNSPSYAFLMIHFCPEYSVGQECWDNSDFSYTIWLDHSSYPGKKQCSYRNNKGKKFCEKFEAF